MWSPLMLNGWMSAVEENDENIFLHLVENGFCKEVLGEEIHRSWL